MPTDQNAINQEMINQLGVRIANDAVTIAQQVGIMSDLQQQNAQLQLQLDEARERIAADEPASKKK